MTSQFRPAACVFLVTALGVALGCGKSPTTGGGPGGPGGASSGNGLFDQHCLKCHSVDGSAGGGMKGPGMKGPDLAKTGAAPEHTAAWVADHIKNPKSHKPDSRMPAFDGNLTPEQIKELADFLAAKK